MIWTALLAVIDGAFAVAEAVDKTITRGRRLARVFRKRGPAEESHPLTYKDVEHQRAQMRSATERRSTIRPPPRGAD